MSIQDKIKTPLLAVDGIVELFDNDNNFKGIVLIERKNAPFGLAIPGGFVDIGETTEEAVMREIEEETGLEVKTIERFVGVYSKPDRDPRFHVVSLVYVLRAIGEPIAKDDAKNVIVVKPTDVEIEKLVFDHKNILFDYNDGIGYLEKFYKLKGKKWKR